MQTKNNDYAKTLVEELVLLSMRPASSNRGGLPLDPLIAERRDYMFRQHTAARSESSALRTSLGPLPRHQEMTPLLLDPLPLRKVAARHTRVAEENVASEFGEPRPPASTPSITTHAPAETDMARPVPPPTALHAPAEIDMATSESLPTTFRTQGAVTKFGEPRPPRRLASILPSAWP